MADRLELRPDLTPKGKGYFGVLRRPDGKVSTELSVGVDINGKETQIPTLIPTLTLSEIDYLLNGGDPRVSQQIMNKAIEHAKQRITQGKSPFAQEGEQGPLPSTSQSILPPNVKTIEDLHRYYSYLKGLEEKYPSEYADLGAHLLGEVEGTRYFVGRRPESERPSRKVRLSNKLSEKDKVPVKTHEYSHLAIDINPNLSQILALIQEPRRALKYPAEMGIGLGNLYHPNLMVEEGLLSYLFPTSEIDKTIRQRKDIYFTPQQLEFLPSLMRHLQYGPTWGSFWGEDIGKGKDIINYMGRPIPMEEILGGR